MNNEIRNELLHLLHYVNGKEENKEFNLKCLLERFEIDIKDKLEDLEYEKQQLEHNLEMVNYVRNEIFKEKV